MLTDAQESNLHIVSSLNTDRRLTDDRCQGIQIPLCWELWQRADSGGEILGPEEYQRILQEHNIRYQHERTLKIQGFPTSSSKVNDTEKSLQKLCKFFLHLRFLLRGCVICTFSWNLSNCASIIVYCINESPHLSAFELYFVLRRDDAEMQYSMY